jgi:hypothetical protein
VGQSRRNAEDASGACCSGGDGMEEGKEQEAQARRKPLALYLPYCGQPSHMSTNWRWRITGPTADNWRCDDRAMPVNPEAVLI